MNPTDALRRAASGLVAVILASGLVLAPPAHADDDEPTVTAVETNADLLLERISLGDQKMNSKLPLEAIVNYKEALEIDPENADVYSRLGYAYVQAEDYDMAVKTYRRWAELKPDDCQAHQSLGFAYMRQGLTDQAIVAYETSLEECPEDPNAYTNLARAYKEGDYVLEAIEGYRRAIELNPSDVSAYENLAILYYERKLYPEAIATYEAILAMPNRGGKTEEWVAWAAERLAAMYRWAESCEKAVPYYKIVLEADPTKDRVLRALAVCYEESGQVAEAIHLYRALIEQIPDKPLYYYRLGELLNDVGRFQEALRSVKEGKMYDTECSSHAYAVSGRAYEKMGGITNYKKAEREFRKCVDCADPNFTSYCEQQIERQQQLAKIEELRKAKDEQGY
ncbi:MAG TPA: tetratricopeptide repeat protein [bacterium]|nr:tetratricopeptide repeat protein [bacterium]